MTHVVSMATGTAVHLPYLQSQGLCVHLQEELTPLYWRYACVTINLIKVKPNVVSIYADCSPLNWSKVHCIDATNLHGQLLSGHSLHGQGEPLSLHVCKHHYDISMTLKTQLLLK